LWPLSREEFPKQFIPLFGNRSTFQHTIDRVTSMELFNPPVVVTASDFRFIVAQQLGEAGCEAQIVLEPSRRDSGPAVAAATELISRRDPNAILLVLPADHAVHNLEAFLAGCREGRAVAEAGWIVTFGILPTFPSVEFGYIRPGAPLAGTTGHQMRSFVEKPGIEDAAGFVANGYLWNSGIFMFPASVMLAEFAQHEPAIAAAAKGTVDAAASDLDFLRLDAAAFECAPKRSLDHAVMERTACAAVVRAKFDWSDVGNWSAVWELLDSDAHGNRVRGAAEFVDARNNLVFAEEGMLAAVVGIDDAFVIVMPDAVLVGTREQSGKVRTLVERLKANNRTEASAHRRVHRPWGYYESIAAGQRYLVKRIVVNPRAMLSLQKHAHRSEHWVVVRGIAEVTIGSEVRELQENESVYIPAGCVHRLGNPGSEPIELVEVQIGDHLSEDDIVRLEDVYRREQASDR
jgi:mannose-1-phosphate guanylyltransferase/mannose-6-phosphate isomerase